MALLSREFHFHCYLNCDDLFLNHFVLSQKPLLDGEFILFGATQRQPLTSAIKRYSKNGAILFLHDHRN